MRCQRTQERTTRYLERDGRRIGSDDPWTAAPSRNSRIVITAGIRRGDEEGFDPVALDSIARELHTGIRGGLTEGHHVVAAESGHNVQLDRPGVVVRAVRDAVASLSGRARPVPDAPPP